MNTIEVGDLLRFWDEYDLVYLYCIVTSASSDGMNRDVCRILWLDNVEEPTQLLWTRNIYENPDVWSKLS